MLDELVIWLEKIYLLFGSLLNNVEVWFDQAGVEGVHFHLLHGVLAGVGHFSVGVGAGNFEARDFVVDFEVTV